MLRVNYVNYLKPISYHDEREIALIYWSFTKSEIWEYEEEVRAMFIDRKGLIPFDKECLKEIYFGLKVDSKQKNEFMEKLKTNNYNLKQAGEMKMNKKSFDIIMNKIKI